MITVVKEVVDRGRAAACGRHECKRAVHRGRCMRSAVGLGSGGVQEVGLTHLLISPHSLNPHHLPTAGCIYFYFYFFQQ